MILVYNADLTLKWTSYKKVAATLNYQNGHGLDINTAYFILGGDKQYENFYGWFKVYFSYNI